MFMHEAMHLMHSMGKKGESNSLEGIFFMLMLPVNFDLT